VTRYYKPDIRSDGLTVDTFRGPVDMVIIERALCGLPVRPNAAETTHLGTLVPLNDRSIAQRIADATGVTLEAVLRRALRARARQEA
jgi:hypothetical protein